MSTAPKIEEDKREINLKNNEEALILRKIFNIIEGKSRKKDFEDNKHSIFVKVNNKNIHLNNLNDDIGINNPQKNKYKIKLQKILFRNIVEK